MDRILDELGICRASLLSRGLCPCEEARVLEIAETGDDGKPHYLTAEAAEAWRNLRDAAEADGIVVRIASAFRSREYQAEIIRRKLDRGAAIEDILAVCAAPGFSEHHTGRAIDVASPGTALLEVEFERSPAFAWLQANASRFGFRLSFPRGNSRGYQYEPWHWCYSGPDKTIP